METIIAILSFVGLVFGVPTAVSLLYGLKFEVKDKNCEEEVKDVERNILWIKISVISITLLLCAIFVIAQI